MSIFDEFDEFEKLFKKLKGQQGASSGYSISVVYGPDGKPIVNVETYGEVNKNELRKEIEKMYPGAEIRGLDKEPLIKEVKEEGEKVDKESVKKSDKKPLIWEEDEE